MVNSGQFWPTTKRYFEHYIWKARAKTEPNGFVQNHLICKWTCVSSRRKLICWVDALAEHRIKRDLGATFHLVSKWRHKEGKNRGKFPKHNYFYCYFYLQQPLATAWGSEYMLLLAWVTNMMRMMMMMMMMTMSMMMMRRNVTLWKKMKANFSFASTAKFCLIVEYLMLHCTDGDDCKLCLYPKTSNMVKMMILRIWYICRS